MPNFFFGGLSTLGANLVADAGAVCVLDDAGAFCVFEAGALIL